MMLSMCSGRGKHLVIHAAEKNIEITDLQAESHMQIVPVVLIYESVQQVRNCQILWELYGTK